MTDLSAVFLGTSDFSVPLLRALHDAPSIRVSAVISMPDRPAGRGRKLSRPPAARYACSLGISLYQPEKLNEIALEIRSLAPSVMVSASFGAWLPRWFLEIPPLGVVNVHPSLLPRHRGASPVVSTILEGDLETGVSFMITDSGWDTGDLVGTLRTPVLQGETAGELEARLAEMAARELPEVLLSYSAGMLKPVPQNGEATYAPKVSPGAAVIDWNASSRHVERLVMAYSPVPGARTMFRGNILKVFRAVSAPGDHPPGIVASVEPLVVGCGSGALMLQEVQPAGKRRMDAGEFVRGWRLTPGEQIEGS